MARSSSVDPLDKFRWEVEIDGFQKLGFTTFQTPSLNVSTKEYAEGGNHFFPKIIVDGVSYGEVALERGVTKDKSFSDWIAHLFTTVRHNNLQLGLVESTGLITGPAGLSTTPIEPVDYRREVIISHLDRTGTVIKKYILHNAIPVEYKPASDFSSDGDDSVSIERLVLKYEGFSVKTIKSSPIADYTKSAAKAATKKIGRSI